MKVQKGRLIIAKTKEALEQQRLEVSFRDSPGMSQNADDTISSMNGEDGEGTLKGIIEWVSTGRTTLSHLQHVIVFTFNYL